MIFSPEQYLHRFRTPRQIISQAAGDQQDNKATQILANIVEEQYKFSDNKQQRVFKQNILAQLKQLIMEWLTRIAQKIGESIQYKYIGIHVFGSYRFQVNKADGDIDTVCLVPNFIRRQDHFNCDLVRVLSCSKNVTDLQLITSTFVPLIKAQIKGVPFDILMANVPVDVLDNIQLLSEQKYLSMMDQRSIRSINGRIVSNYLTKQFSKNQQNFKLALRSIKLWAKNRHIYSQLLGFLGGIGVTILMGKILQLYPNYPASKLLDRFFFIYSRWQWKQLPVMLQPVPFQILKQWRNQNFQMTLIPPTNTFTNSAFNVSKSTLWAIRQQLARGNKLLQKVKAGKAKINQLFKPFIIFQTHKNFLQITAMANTRSDQLQWKGIIQSRIKRLVKSLEQSQNSQYLRFRPFPNSYQIKVDSYKQACCFFLGVTVLPQTPKHLAIDIIKQIRQFVEHVQSLQPLQRLGQYINLKIRIVPRHRLHPYLFQNNQLPIYAQLVQ